MPDIDLPAPGEDPNWAGKLNTGIETINAAVDALPDQIAADVDDDTTAIGGALKNTFLSYIQAAKNPDLLVVGAITGDPMTSAAVIWPDGKPGVLTITARHSSGAVNAYNITHVDGATTTTYTQPAITRATSGTPTNVPQIVVS